jgi:hypothetical protein
MPRFIAFHPALFSCWNKIYSVAAAEASPGGFQKRPLTNRAPALLVNQALSEARHRRRHADVKKRRFFNKIDRSKRASAARQNET